MKKIFSMSFIALAAMLFVASCDSATEEKVEEKMDTMAEKAETTMEDMVDRDSLAKDKDFVKEATKANKMELHMLAMGKTMGTSKEVKDAASKMEKDHKKLDKEMRAYAAKKNYEIDTASADMDHPDEKKGADWDKKWVNDMVDGHEKTIKKFEDAQNDVKDPELKTMITDALPALREHLEMSKNLQAKMNR